MWQETELIKVFVLYTAVENRPRKSERITREIIRSRPAFYRIYLAVLMRTPVNTRADETQHTQVSIGLS